jgi:RNA polymerase sigma factor (sigma-70 family)
MQKAIVSDLIPRQREILTLKYAANKKGVEIAELLGINLSRVTRVLQRAEKTLQKSLRFYMEFLNSDLDDE